MGMLPIPTELRVVVEWVGGGLVRVRVTTSLAVAVLLATVLAALAGCSSTSGSSSSTTGRGSSVASAGGGTTVPPCPVAPVPVVVSVDQWGALVRDLAGACAQVTTIVSGSGTDPHEYEPTTGDIARFGDARLVVVNGLAYDAWATKAVDALSTRPPVVDAGEVAGRHEGDNPHVWYDPVVVDRVAAAVTDRLVAADPGAAGYFADRNAAWQADMRTERDLIASIAASAGGRTYAATEPVFDDLARAVGLRDVTPPGYRRSAANGSEPAPGDVNAFGNQLRPGSTDVLIVNTQTQGAVPDQLRGIAEANGVRVVEVTEAPPAGTASFTAWQVAQLTALRDALAATR